MKKFKPIYRLGEAVYYLGRAIGEVYPCNLRNDNKDEWGNLVYINDCGWEGSTKAQAIKHVYDSHMEYIAELQYKLNEIQKQLKEWT